MYSVKASPKASEVTPRQVKGYTPFTGTGLSAATALLRFAAFANFFCRRLHASVKLEDTCILGSSTDSLVPKMEHRQAGIGLPAVTAP